MTINELADYIRLNKPGINYPGVHMVDDRSVVLQYTRHEMLEDVHTTDEHIFSCCAKATSYDEHIELCRPLAKADTEKFRMNNATAKCRKAERGGGSGKVKLGEVVLSLAICGFDAIPI